MAKRRSKTRTHVKQSEEDLAKIPKSMVIHLGTALANHSLTQLVKDTRNMMQPHTAISLRERKSNKLKDFVVMAGPLGVTQLMIFSQSEETGSSQLRIARTPHGPTISFKIRSYSLCKDVSRYLKHPKSISKQSPEFLSPPLLVMNGFTNPKDASPHEKLVITMFQAMFPPISPQTTKVSSIKRVLLLNRDKETGHIELRHYAIDTKLVDVSKGVKRLINLNKNPHKRLPNLAKVGDMSDIILDPYANAGGYTSESEVEEDSVVDVKDDVTLVARHKTVKPAEDEKKNVRKRAIKLTELGPRMSLDLVKIEDGICAGKVLHHAYVSKSEKEINQLEQRHAVKRKLKEERRKAQQKNVEAKRAVKEAKKKRREEARKRGEAVESDSSDEDSDAPESDFEEFSD